MANLAIELFLRGAALCLITRFALLLLHRAPAAYRHLMCVVALCGLLVLPPAQRLLPPLRLLPLHPAVTPKKGVVPSGTSGLPSIGDTTFANSVVSEQSPGHDVRTHSSPLVPDDTAAISHSTPVVTSPSHQARPWNAKSLLLALWGVGVVVMLARLVVALLRLRRLEAQSQARILDGVQVRVSEVVETPLTWGIRRRVILLPAALVSGDAAACESAIRHELAHITRWDWVWSLFAEVVCALCWFQPGAWWLRRRMRQESERACDDRVLLSGIAGPDYAAHLLQILRSGRTSEVAPAMAHSGGMEDRMRHILDSKQPRHPKRLWMAVATPVGFGLLSLAALRVSARPADGTTTVGHDAANRPSGKLIPSAQRSPISLPAAESAAPTSAGMPFADLPPRAGNREVPPMPHRAPTSQPGIASPQNSPPAAPSHVAPAPSLEHVVWGKAVDGMEPGFLQTTPGFPQNGRLALNSLVTYQVLVRNSTRQDRVLEVQCQSFHAKDPYLIPDANLRQALGGSKIPDEYRTVGVTDLSTAYLGYTVKLAPGESVLLPELLHLYLGDAEPQSYPRISRITPGKSWLVHPISVQSLTSTEAAAALSDIDPLFGNGIHLTIRNRDGSSSLRRGACYFKDDGSKTIYAKIPLEIGTTQADNLPAGESVQWGEKVAGLQLGARIAQNRSIFNVGETIDFQPFGRNLTGVDIHLTVGNYWKVNYTIQVQTLDGKPIYMERSGHNHEMLVAGYIGSPLANGASEEISKAKLKLTHPTEARLAGAGADVNDEWVEAIPLKPGHYRIRLVSGGVFGTRKPEPASGWIPIEVTDK